MKRRLLSLLLAVCMMITMISFPAQAATSSLSSGSCGDYLTWSLDADGTLTISGTGDMDSYSGTTASLYAPWHSKTFARVMIENGVTSVSSAAFYGCESMSSIVIPDTVASIGANAFNGCTGLGSITIPDSVTAIGSGAFYGCKALNSIAIPDSVTEIGTDTFYSCTALNTVTIPDSVISIGNDAFRFCSGLTSVTIPSATIGTYAFASCTGLTRVTMTAAVTSIGNNAFRNCTGIENVYYAGTSTQWSAISIGTLNNTNLKNASRHYGDGTQKAITDCTVTLGTNAYTYDGSAKEPAVTVQDGASVLSRGTDYTVAYYYNTNVGTAVAEITGTGSYMGSINKTFLIKAVPELGFASSSVSKKTTDGSFINELTKVTDALPTYSSSNTGVAVVAGDGTVTIQGAGTAVITAEVPETTNYASASSSYTLTVTAPSVSDCTVTLSKTSYTYDGTAKKPDVTVKYNSLTLTAGTDYTVSYSNNTNAGTATVTVTGAGAYVGFITKNFTIDKASAGLSFASASVSKKSNDGSFINELTKATDALPSYISSNTGVAMVASDGTVTVQGLGTAVITAEVPETTNYNAGSASYTLTVTSESIDISNCTVTLGTSSYTYDGTAKQPTVTVKNGTTTLVNGTDYTVFYSNNTNAGTATVAITGKGNYTGTVTKPFSINKADAGLSFASTSINKKTTDSNFTNTLTKKTDSAVTYASNNTSVATVSSAGAVTIKGAGTATITASTAATTNYNAGTASYTVTVATANDWTTANEFWFSNSSAYFTTGKYTMLDSDFTKLCNYIKQNYTASNATNIINCISANRDETWGGSCFGMAASTLLDYSGQIEFNENFDSGKSTMHDVSSPNQNSKVQSAINYYFMAQMIPMTRNINKCYSKGSSTWALGLKQLVSQAMAGDKLLFCYFTSSYGHAIVVKGYDGTDADGNYRLIAYDNRYPNKDTIVLISGSYSTCTVNGSENALSIEYTSDLTAYDKIDIDGPNNDMVISSSSPSGSQSINGTEIYVTLDSDIEIMNSSNQYIKIEDGLVTDSTIDILDTHMIVRSTADGTSKSAELMLNVADSDYFSFESNGTQISASVLNSDQYSSVEASGADGVVLSSSEGISVLGSNVTYKVYQSVDEDDFEMFSFEGTTSGDANISYSDRTINVTGNAPGSINVTTYTEDATEELTFDTTKSKVNISIPEEQDHTHEKGTYHAIVKATCSDNGSIAYWDCTGCDKKLDENGNEITTTTAIEYPETFTLSTTTYAYNGKVKTPTLKIYDSEGELISSSNYTITYPAGRKNVGTYTYKVTFKGSYYSGTKKVSFKIVPKTAKLKKVSVGKRYITVYSSAKASSYAGTGFRIAYRVSGTSKWKYTTTTSTSKKITGLTKGKKYEVIIRAYKKVGSTTYYGAWSSKKISAAVK